MMRGIIRQYIPSLSLTSLSVLISKQFYSLVLSKVYGVHSTRFVIPRFFHKDRKTGEYGGILRDEGNRPEEHYLTFFYEDGYCDQERLWMTNIRCNVRSKARIINLSNSKQALCFAMNPKTKGKGNLMTYVYFNTSVAAV